MLSTPVFLIVSLLACIYWAWRAQTKKARARDHTAQLEGLFTSMLRNIANDQITDVRELTDLLARGGFRYAELLRQAEIVFESLRIARNSPNADTAQSRIELAGRLWDEAVPTLKLLLLPAFFAELDQNFEMRLRAAHTGTVLNQVKRLLEKALKLKTDRGRVKYIRHIEDLFTQALQNPLVDHGRILAMRDKIQEEALDLRGL